MLHVLSLLGFPAIFISWIHSCISTTSFSILLNGSPIGTFTSSCGLCQGDPLSHSLFIIGAEILTRLLHWEEQKTNLKGIQLNRGGPSFSHLLFADDLILLGRATIYESKVSSYSIQILCMHWIDVKCP